MTSTALMRQTIKEYTECLICKKTLGADSREAGFMFCHDHRKCSICDGELNSNEARWCLKSYLEKYEKLDFKEGEAIDYSVITIVHPRCKAINHTVSISDSELDYLNLCRLLVTPNTDLSAVSNENIAMNASARLLKDMNHEQKLLHITMMQACIAQAQIIVKQDKEYKKDGLAEREKKHFDKARREAITSTRPATKTSEDSEELQLGHFMELHEITERKLGLEYMKKYNNGVKQFLKIGMAEQVARDMSIKALIDGGFIKK